MHTFNVTITQELPYPMGQQIEEMARVVIGPYEWEHRCFRDEARQPVWLTIRHPEDNYNPPDAHTRVMLNALCQAQADLDEKLAAADAAMGDMHP